MGCVVNYKMYKTVLEKQFKLRI